MMLKKLLCLTALSLIIGFSSYAQQYQLEKDTFEACTDVGTEPHPEQFQLGDNWESIDMHNYLTNISNDTITYKWTVITSETSIPAGWTFYGFCDNRLCRSPFGPWSIGVTDSSAPLAPGTDPGINRDFKALICAPSDKPNGMAVIRIRVVADQAPNQVDTATFIFKKKCNWTTGIDQIAVDDKRVVLYPSPASAFLEVYSEKSLNASRISIFNIAGSNLINRPVAKGAERTKIDVGSLSPGIYMVRIADANGNIITARKFTKN